MTHIFEHLISKALLNSSADNSIFYCIVTVVVSLSVFFFNIFLHCFFTYNTHTHAQAFIKNCEIESRKIGIYLHLQFHKFSSCLLYLQLTLKRYIEGALSFNLMMVILMRLSVSMLRTRRRPSTLTTFRFIFQ